MDSEYLRRGVSANARGWAKSQKTWMFISERPGNLGTKHCQAINKINKKSFNTKNPLNPGPFSFFHNQNSKQALPSNPELIPRNTVAGSDPRLALLFPEVFLKANSK